MFSLSVTPLEVIDLAEDRRKKHEYKQDEDSRGVSLHVVNAWSFVFWGKLFLAYDRNLSLIDIYLYSIIRSSFASLSCFSVLAGFASCLLVRTAMPSSGFLS